NGLFLISLSIVLCFLLCSTDNGFVGFFDFFLGINRAISFLISSIEVPKYFCKSVSFIVSLFFDTILYIKALDPLLFLFLTITTLLFLSIAIFGCILGVYSSSFFFMHHSPCSFNELASKK